MTGGDILISPPNAPPIMSSSRNSPDVPEPSEIAQMLVYRRMPE